MGIKDSFSSIDVIHEQLTRHRYISDQPLATVLYLSYHLSKPIFLEGEPGVGKTAIAEGLALKIVANALLPILPMLFSRYFSSVNLSCNSGSMVIVNPLCCINKIPFARTLNSRYNLKSC